MAKYLVVYGYEKGFGSVDCEFLHVPPTVEDIKETQIEIKKIIGSAQTPVIINWMPIAEEQQENYNFSKRVVCPEYVEWLEDMVVMLSKDFLELVKAAPQGFLEANTKFLSDSDDTRKAIRTIMEKANCDNKSLSSEEIEHYTKMLLYNKQNCSN